MKGVFRTFGAERPKQALAARYSAKRCGQAFGTPVRGSNWAWNWEDIRKFRKTPLLRWTERISVHQRSGHQCVAHTSWFAEFETLQIPTCSKFV